VPQSKRATLLSCCGSEGGNAWTVSHARELDLSAFLNTRIASFSHSFWLSFSIVSIN